MDNKEIVILAGKNGGGPITPGTLVIVSGQMTDAQAAQFRANIGAISAEDIGNVFTIKGSVATVADLPASGNNVGDVYYVEAVSAGYIWLTSETQPNGYWEELGETIDLSAYELKPTVVYPTGSAVTITPAANTIYKCGTLDSLTISNPPATGAYSITFTSGATPTQALIPPKPAMLWQTDDNEPPQGFPAANTRYEINVKDTYVVLGEWHVPEVSA